MTQGHAPFSTGKSCLDLLVASKLSLSLSLSWSPPKEEDDVVKYEAKGGKKGYFTLDRTLRKGVFTTDWGPLDFVKSNHPLSIMVRQCSLLH